MDRYRADPCLMAHLRTPGRLWGLARSLAWRVRCRVFFHSSVPFPLGQDAPSRGKNPITIAQELHPNEKRVGRKSPFSLIDRR